MHRHQPQLAPSLFIGLLVCASSTIAGPGLASGQVGAPDGFSALFDGQSLVGWWGLGTEDPRVWQALPEVELAAKREASFADIREHWSVENGELVNDGAGLYLTTLEEFGDFELLVEYKTVAQADSGIYLRGVPQVQIWDTTKAGGKWEIGAKKGSGGLWNNSPGAPGKDPAQLVDKPFGEWNQFRVVMVGARVSVWLNDALVVDHALLENYFDRARPIPRRGPIQLQTHGGEIRWRNIYVRPIDAREAHELLRQGGHGAKASAKGFEPIFNGRDLEGWAGATDGYEVAAGNLACKADSGGTVYYDQELSDFEVEFEFRLPPGGNNGLALRYPGEGDTAYVGMCELQVLDNTHPKYAELDARQYHGSVYGQVAAERGYLREPGQWNFQRVRVAGPRITVELNGTVILDRDLSTVEEFMYEAERFAGRSRTSGFFGLAGHGDPVAFRGLRVKTLD